MNHFNCNFDVRQYIFIPVYTLSIEEIAVNKSNVEIHYFMERIKRGESNLVLEAWLWVRGQQQRGVVQNIRGTEKSLSLKANMTKTRRLLYSVCFMLSIHSVVCCNKLFERYPAGSNTFWR